MLDSIGYREHIIHSLLTREEEFGGNISVPYSPEYDLMFGKVKCIWTYSWRMEDTAEGLKRRGTVEEWMFGGTEEAVQALDFLKREGDHIGFPYYKTASFHLQRGTRLYLFHSDNSGVAYRHKRFHKWLEDRSTCI